MLAAALCSVGIPARPLGLMTADAETTESGAGHVVVEAWLPDRRRWAMADAQCDVVPLVDGEPVHAVDLMTALGRFRGTVVIEGLTAGDTAEYLAFLAPYLFFYAVPRSVRFDVPPPTTHGGRLMLVTIGQTAPTVFQRRWPITDVTGTDSAASFYAAPA